MAEKRHRGKNFSILEEHILVELVEEHKYVLENKKSDTITWKEKIETWEKLSQNFASQSGIHRPWKVLRDKYENLKRKSKLELASEKRETYRTGGGTPSKSSVSNISEKISGLIGESATGLYNPYDNDANNNLPVAKKCESDELEDFVVEVLVDDNGEVVEEITEEQCSSFSASKWNPTKLKEKVNKKLSVGTYNQRKTTLEEEKIKLTKLQQNYYKEENERAAEKHTLEMEKYQSELTSMKLKNDLIELEIKEKKRRLAI